MPDWNYHGLCPQLLRGVQHQGWLLPTAIQDEALPAILGGGDVCGAAETGSGKTAAFVLPILQLVQEELQPPTSPPTTTASSSSSSSSATSASSHGMISEICLSLDDRDSMLAVAQPDRRVCQSRMERQWCGVRATVGVCGSAAKVFYEATVDDEGLCRVGWSTASAKLDVGTDNQSWGFGGTGKKSHGRKFITYGRAFGKGDVLGCVLDLCSKNVSFRLNGEDCGEAFKLPGNDQVYFPAVVLKNAQMSFNFGCDLASRPMRFPPDPSEGVVPLGSASPEHLRQGIRKKSRTKAQAKSRQGSGGGNIGNALCSPRALILAPTRDLAQQIHECVETLATFLIDPPILSALMVGGDARQLGTLKGAHVIVGTCGRMRDMVKRGKISLAETRFFVLDEADQMAKDKESLATVRELYRACAEQDRAASNSQLSRLQVCFFSATLHSAETRSLAEEITQHATWVDLKGKDVVPETVHHVVVPVTTQSAAAPWGKSIPALDKFTDGVHAREDDALRPARRQGASKEAKSQIVKRLKLEVLKKVLDTFHMDTCMIFCRTNLDCDNVEKYLNGLSSYAGGRGGGYQGKRESGKEDPYSCVVVAGKRRQQERRDNLEAFKDGDVRFLVCTDVAARGIDLKELPFVINLTLPDDPAQYYHRIGRVGRAGKLGLAISIVAIEDDEKVWYHANCRKKGGVGCTNTRLLGKGGCCIYYDEPACLQRCEDKLGSTIPRIAGDDLVLPDGMRVEDYGADADAVGRGASKQDTSTRIKSLRPAVEELCGMEAEVQTLWLQSTQRFSRESGN